MWGINMGRLTNKEKELVLKFLKKDLKNNPLVKECYENRSEY